jgi:predicted SnoaL-like aldol condensation-catalyzing enzyme
MTTSTNDNKTLVLAGIKGVFIDRDPTVLDRLFGDDYRQHNPLIPNGTAAIKSLLGNLSRDFEYQPGLVVADGDYVMVHGRYVGMGIEADGCGRYFPRGQWQDHRTLGRYAGRGPS